MKALKKRFKDKLKNQKTYNKLLNMRQGKRLVQDFNKDFNEVLLELEERPNEQFLLNMYTHTLEYEFSSPFADLVPSLIDEAMTRSERRKQLKGTHKDIPLLNKPMAIEEKPTPMDLGKGKIICLFCKTPGHSLEECRKKTKGEVQKKEEKKCFKCRKPGHFAKDCTKIASVVMDEIKPDLYITSPNSIEINNKKRVGADVTKVEADFNLRDLVNYLGIKHSSSNPKGDNELGLSLSATRPSLTNKEPVTPLVREIEGEHADHSSSL